MPSLRLLMMVFLLCGSLPFANAAGLFGGPKTLPDDGTYTPRGSGSFSNPGGSCQVGCNSSAGHIQVDIQARCMCISGDTCFKVDIGAPPLQTTNGVGRMGPAAGGTYKTRSYTDSSKFDYDAVSMGIAANTVYGKWIHKARDCQGGGRQTTGCIGVPCGKWPEVKQLALAGKSIQVCNGANFPASRDFCPPGSSPCYAKISKSAAAKGLSGLYVPKKSNGKGSGQERGQTR